MSKEPGIYELDRIKRLHDRLTITDEQIPVWLPILGPILGVIGGIFFLMSIFTAPFAGPGAVLGGLSIFFFLGFIGTLIEVYLVYKWLDVINNHFNRVRELYKEVGRYLEEKGYKKFARYVQDDLREMEYRMGGEKSPVLWAILVFLISILIWYVLHLVNKSVVKMGHGEYGIYSRIEDLAKEANLDVRMPDYGKFRMIAERNTILYIILSIVTIGLFTIYWAYAVTKDLNQHLEIHRLEESDFIRCLESLPTTSQE